MNVTCEASLRVGTTLERVCGGKHVLSSRMEMMNVYQCRICLGHEKRRLALIAPCACRGSATLVHRKCIDDWRRTQLASDNVPDSLKCQTCNAKYALRITPTTLWWSVVWTILYVITTVVWITIVLFTYWSFTFVAAFANKFTFRPSWTLMLAAAKDANHILFIIGTTLLYSIVLPKVMRVIRRWKEACLQVVNKIHALPYILDRGTEAEPEAVPYIHAHNTRASARREVLVLE